MIMRILIVLAGLILFTWLVSLAGAGESRYVVTPPDVVEAMLEAVNVTKRDVVVDLGCGDGRIPIIAATKYGVTAVGVEYDMMMVDVARRNVTKNKVASLVTIRQADVLQTRWSKSPTVVTVYLDSELLGKLKSVLSRLPIGSRIVSHQHPLLGWVAGKPIKLGKHLIYRYRTVRAVRKQRVCGSNGCSYIDVPYTAVVGY